MKKRFAMKIGIVLICALLIMLQINAVFIDKNGNAAMAAKVDAKENDPENREHLDVAFLGGSHALVGYSAQWAARYSGLDCYNFSTSGQPIYLSYYYLKEILKKYQFDTLVLDVYYLGLNEEYFSMTDYVRSVIDGLSLSKNKMEMIWHCLPPEERLSAVFPIFKYHSRWDSLTEADFQISAMKQQYDRESWKTGTNPDELILDIPEDGRLNKNLDESEKHREKGEIPPRSMEYLEKILKLCDQEGIKVVLTTLPHQYNLGQPVGDWAEEYGVFNSLHEYAKQRGIPFLEFNSVLEEMNYDFSYDMMNYGHANEAGTRKITKYIMEYISEE